MNYYSFHIGDFRAGTVNMTRQARWIYRDMLDVYYDTERPLSLDFDRLCDDIGVMDDAERAIVQRLLRFKFIETENGFVHEVCDVVISEYRIKATTAQANGKLGGRPRKANSNPEKPSGLSNGFDSNATGNLSDSESKTNQEPLTNNQKPKKKTAAAPPFVLPDWIDQTIWDTWHSTPKRKKATPEQKALAVQTLSDWRDAGLDHAASLKAAAVAGWQGLFLRESTGAKSATQNKQQALERRNRDVGQEWARGMEDCHAAK